VINGNKHFAEFHSEKRQKDTKPDMSVGPVCQGQQIGSFQAGLTICSFQSSSLSSLPTGTKANLLAPRFKFELITGLEVEKAQW